MAEYLSALWKHWVSLMTGVVGLIVAFCLRIGRNISDKLKYWSDIPDWIFITVGIICLFWAGYATWKDQNKKVTALEKQIDDLKNTEEKEKKKREIYLALYKFISQANEIQTQCRGLYLDELKGESLKERFIRWCKDIDDEKSGFFVKNLTYEPYHTKFENISKYGYIPPPPATGGNCSIWENLEKRKRNLAEIAEEFKTDPLL
jgi:hypothetical protein